MGPPLFVTGFHRKIVGLHFAELIVAVVEVVHKGPNLFCNPKIEHHMNHDLKIWYTGSTLELLPDQVAP